jgi:uncharacterized membrane protein YkgB
MIDQVFDTDLGPRRPTDVAARPLNGDRLRRSRQAQTNGEKGLRAAANSLLTRWLARYSIPLLRVSLGLIFFIFGALKFLPGVSPAQGLADRTTADLTFGLITGTSARLLVATLEVAIGICLISGRRLRLGLALMGVATVGILSPLVLFPGELFGGKYHAPTLEGQYVMKDIVVLAGGLVVAARQRGGYPLPIEGAGEGDETA